MHMRRYRWALALFYEPALNSALCTLHVACLTLYAVLTHAAVQVGTSLVYECAAGLDDDERAAFEQHLPKAMSAFHFEHGKLLNISDEQQNVLPRDRRHESSPCPRRRTMREGEGEGGRERENSDSKAAAVAARIVSAVQMQLEIRICHTEEFDAEDAEKPFKLTGMACALPGVLCLWMLSPVRGE